MPAYSATPWKFTKHPMLGTATHVSRTCRQQNECRQSSQVWECFEKSHPIVLARKASFVKRLHASLWAPVGYKNRLPRNRRWWEEGSHRSVVRCEGAAGVFHQAHRAGKGLQSRFWERQPAKSKSIICSIRISKCFYKPKRWWRKVLRHRRIPANNAKEITELEKSPFM